jgi:hypothetical protein
MSLPYIGPDNNTNYHAEPLKDFGGNEYGEIKLCNVPKATPSLPSPSGGIVIPAPVQAPITFSEVFTALANNIGQQLITANSALLALHTTWMLTHQAPRTLINSYLAATRSILVHLGYMGINDNGKLHKYWPLVSLNPGRIQAPLNSPVVSSVQAKNNRFPQKPGHASPNGPDRDQALYFTVPVLGDEKKAVGSIVFYQDCEWETGTTDPTKWSSWGFITNFELTLFEEETTIAAKEAPKEGPKPEATSSSSSSSYYAASSAVPIG